MSTTESSLLPTRIQGCLLQPLAIVPTPSGPVLHFLRQTYPLMPEFPDGFGEIYFSEIYPGSVKAWKRHSRQAQLFAVPVGRIRIALYDSRRNSLSHDVLEIIELGRPDNYSLLAVPPGIWYGFMCLSQRSALICNCADIPHNPEESEKLPADTPLIPYKWE